MKQFIKILRPVLISILLIVAIYSAYTGFTVSNSQERKINQFNVEVHENKKAWESITIGNYTPLGFYKELGVGNTIIRTTFTITIGCLSLIIVALLLSKNSNKAPDTE